MAQPKVSRPILPKGYVDAPIREVTWAYVEQRLQESRNYWLCSVRPNRRPHVIPRWGVWVDDKFYYDGSPETRHAQNLAHNPAVSLHLENAEQVVILDGSARPAGKPAPDLAQRLSAAYRAKYAASGYAPEPSQWDEGGLYVFTPRMALAWTTFFEDPTKFTFD